LTALPFKGLTSAFVGKSLLVLDSFRCLHSAGVFTQAIRLLCTFVYLLNVYSL